MSALNPSNIWALLNLAWRTLLHFLTYPLRRRRGAQALVADYQLLPVTPEMRAHAPAATACVGCGKCDVMLPEASLLILRLGREAADAPYAISTIAKLEPVADAITALCPYGVDVPALLLLARR